MKPVEESTPVFTILVINPGSTSTKVALFEGEQEVFKSVLPHSPKSLGEYAGVVDQLAFREAAVYDFMVENGIIADRLDAVVGRGGLLKPIPGGTYQVSSDMLEDLKMATYGEHASNLGALIADSISRKLQIPAYIVDPVTTDEFEPSARISGVPDVSRRCRNHALNIKAVARRAADKMSRPLHDTSFVVSHLGGGASVCALSQGRIIDSTDALLGEGPFSMDRAGTIASERIIEMCFEQGLSREQIIKRLTRDSGFKGYLGETDLKSIQKRIEDGDQLAAVVMAGFVQQVAKWIGAMTVVLKCQVDSIIITGGMAHSKALIDDITSYVNPLAPIMVFPGELEMEALAEGAIRVLAGREKHLTY